MGVWGMGVAQSDEFCDIYERFMEQYDEGGEPSAIGQSLLQEYIDEFGPDDGILHDVYFAIAKAQWMCCAPDETVLAKVREIIESGANIEFYRELEADERDLKQRQKNLLKFLDQLQFPREKPRKRRPPKPETPMPDWQAGDVLYYKDAKNGVYHAAAVIDTRKDPDFRRLMRLILLAEDFSGAPPIESLWNCHVAKGVSVMAEDLPAKSARRIIGRLPLPAGDIPPEVTTFLYYNPIAMLNLVTGIFQFADKKSFSFSGMELSSLATLAEDLSGDRWDGAFASLRLRMMKSLNASHS